MKKVVKKVKAVFSSVSNSIAKNVTGDTAGYFLTTASKTKKRVETPMYTNNKGYVNYLPKTEETTAYLPYKSLGKASMALGIGITALDVTGTWSDSDLSVGQKMTKTTIVAVGFGASIGAGMVAAGLGVAVTSTLCLPVGVAVGLIFVGATSYGIAKGQDRLYRKWGLE